MSGHNKWSSIKHRKGAQDQKRGKVFTKLIRDITIAVKESGKDQETNAKLRAALEKARVANMPKDTVNLAIKRGAGEIQGESFEEFNYEGYGPGGVAILLEILTNNRNRAASEVRNIFERHSGNLGETGCVGWLFERKGLICIQDDTVTEDKLMDLSLEAGAEDIRHEKDEFMVTTDPASFEKVKTTLEKAGLTLNSAELTMIPQNTVKLDGKNAEKMLKIMDALEELDDVQNVYANFEIDEEIIEQFMEK
ncbi:MAG: YebC/PmpR family DNA-binding transcriptional regulator [Candidatus Wallbacteria bacterium]|nr:YebC/PmpR family DNA-binding transcriptional regulator [Candidatus Wallbacteria bacterium]